ncbi:MAG TPA: hypothetical protein VF544_16760 [Pyrinomonadaceae bacterium]|jgi:hypothetical protein
MRYLNRPATSAANFIFCASAACALTLLLPVMSGGPRALGQTQTPREMGRADLEARQRALRNMDNVKAKLSRKRSEPRPVVYQQTKEDFEQLQLVNYHLSEMVAASAALDYEQISKGAAEVKKRASRLKGSLLLLEPEKDEKPQKSREETVTDELKPAITALNELVNSFVWNPVFQHPQVLDVEHSVQARRDLEGIIRLSEQIHKRAEALSKATGKSH